MKRFAFKMILKPGCEDEYAKRHAAIWPELKQMIKGPGRGQLQYLLGQRNQPALRLPGMRRRRQQPGHGERGPHHPALVGHDGRHHGGEPRQFARHHSAEGTFPHGLRFNGECRMENGKL